MCELQSKVKETAGLSRSITCALAKGQPMYLLNYNLLLYRVGRCLIADGSLLSIEGRPETEVMLILVLI